MTPAQLDAKQPVAAPNQELRHIYRNRFAATHAYRKKVWGVLVSDYFRRWIQPTDAVLDLGCGYGEFINQIAAGQKYGMDLNPDAKGYLDPGIRLIEHNCAEPWPLEQGILDVVFMSNFLEHLPDKSAVKDTLTQALRCLRPGGRLIAMGPNIRYLPGAYWDFFDHHTALTDRSLQEILELLGFTMELVLPRFLPYTLQREMRHPLWVLKLYLRLPWLYWTVGRQFLLVARKAN